MTCVKIDDKVEEMAGMDGGHMEKYDSPNWVYPIPGSDNSYHCANSKLLLILLCSRDNCSIIEYLL